MTVQELAEVARGGHVNAPQVAGDSDETVGHQVQVEDNLLAQGQSPQWRQPTILVVYRLLAPTLH